MKTVFHNPKLIISAPSKKQWPDSNLPEIILAGKSNVGKSSFINALVNRKSLAYVGQTPGKTRLLNFYNLDDHIMLVDAPGYGYAKRSKSEAIDYGRLMEEYFRLRANVYCCILILDIRHLPSNNDLEMRNFLKHNNIPHLIILTKADKLSYSNQLKMQRDICNVLEVSTEEVIVFSSIKKDQVEKVWERIYKLQHTMTTI